MCLAVTSGVTPARRFDTDTDEENDAQLSDDTNTLLYSAAGALVFIVPIVAAVVSRCRDARSEEEDIDYLSAYSIQSVASAYSANIPGYGYY